MSTTKHLLLDQIEAQLTNADPPAPRRARDAPKSRHARRAVAGLTSMLALSGVVVFAGGAPAFAADSCQPTFKPATHGKICYGYVPVRFDYKSTSWYGGTQCYSFERHQMTCSVRDWYYTGMQAACKKYY